MYFDCPTTAVAATMKFFRSALTSTAPIPEFGGNSLVFRMEEEQPNYRKLC